MKKLLALSAFFAAVTGAFRACAYEGMAKPWQLGFQTPATPVMERLYSIHDFLLIIITIITLLVLLLMVYICLRFNRRANPVPSKTAHNTRLEIIWTTVPILILVAIAIPSLRIHYFMQRVVDPQMTLKAVGYQWYWHYEYPDQGGVNFDSYLKKGKDLLPTEHRLLAVDNHVVVPVDTTVRVLVTGADVIHSWAMPAFGVKRDGVPGRLNETWFRAEKLGTFYGQCSELCGVGHGFMPIVVDVVSKDDFNGWVAKKQKEAGIGQKPAEAPAPAAKTTVPLAKPETAKDVNPTPRAQQEKNRSDQGKEGKPKTGEVAPVTDNSEAPAAPQDTTGKQ